MSTTLAPDGTEIAYRVHGGGDGPTVVLVHGITEQQRNWDPIVARLADRHRVVTLDLRGHGESAPAATYDLGSMVGDVAAVLAATGAQAPHLVGHSLGGMVVTACGAALPTSSIVNVDQSLEMAGFKTLVGPLEPVLKDADSFGSVVEQLFDAMAGALDPEERARIESLRRADQQVVLGVWQILFELDEAAIAQVVDEVLAGYADRQTRYLTVFGTDPGPDYADWLGARIPGTELQVWEGLGHYPHLVEPDRFVQTLESFW